MLSGSVHVKAACRTLMKLTTGVNFINIFCAAFTHVDPESVNKYSYVISIFSHFWGILRAQKLFVEC